MCVRSSWLVAVRHLRQAVRRYARTHVHTRGAGNHARLVPLLSATGPSCAWQTAAPRIAGGSCTSRRPSPYADAATLSSEPGAGLRSRQTLPGAACIRTYPRGVRASGATSPHCFCGGRREIFMRPRKTILCVDDNEQALSVRKFMLETRGYRVLTAHHLRSGAGTLFRRQCRSRAQRPADAADGRQRAGASHEG